MSKITKLKDKAANNPAGITFSELCTLAEAAGFVHSRTKGSHKMYKHPNCVHPDLGKRRNIQPDKNGKAKPTQVKEMLEFIDYFDLI
jgi:predicted RNA binding protein YcfA (HicA-like mRNA interferase family)